MENKNNIIDEYIKNVNEQYILTNSTEHSYRSYLKILMEKLIGNNFAVTNEPARIECGSPDFIITKNEIPIGYIETKDVGKNLNSIAKTEQIKRYLSSLDNFILTDYLEFHFYKNNEKEKIIKIAEVKNEKIQPIKPNFNDFIRNIEDFSTFRGQNIKNTQELAGRMARKTQMIEKVFYQSLIKSKSSDLEDQRKVFEENLIHDLDKKRFAGMYSETIAYGLFTACLNNNNGDFSRQKARDLIPRSNPFLRILFDYVCGAQLDRQIIWIVDDLCDLLDNTDFNLILKEFSKKVGYEDPFIHFYETFLAEYNPKLRKSKGVYYTPTPVVQFIIKAVDDILIQEFNLKDGLADTSKITNEIRNTKNRLEKIKVHKVQILDPATGTGTFLAKTIEKIHSKIIDNGQEGLWTDYVENDLLPRVNGFELLMSAYTMGYLKIQMLLQKTGYKLKDDDKKRIKVFLTNSLEEAKNIDERGVFITKAISDEAKGANDIKTKKPVMCVIGNPPYSGISSNKEKWITELINQYKYTNGSYFNERKHWLNDDYVKFIRRGQKFIEDNGSGVLGYINNNGFLDNTTFRGMRWNLLKAFDKIYIIDLHGNARKKETTPNKNKDENVFDIQQGVSINLFIKTGKKKQEELGEIFHFDLYGKRKEKFNFLNKNTLKTIRFSKLKYNHPNYFFVPKNEKGLKKYNKGIKLDKLFPINGTGIVSAGDSFSFDKDPNKLVKRINNFLRNNYSNEDLNRKYSLGKNYAQLINKNKDKIKKIKLKPIKILYRPFDEYYTIFNTNLLARCRIEIMQHLFDYENFTKRENVGLIFNRPAQGGANYFSDIFITKNIICQSIFSAIKRSPYIAPLYRYPNGGEFDFEKYPIRAPNLNEKIVEQIAQKLGLVFTPEKEKTANTFAPIDILDYIYAVLHSPTYREMYKEFLKIDFPRVPYPDDKEKFWQLVILGKKIRELHLFNSTKINNTIISYPKQGNNEVEKISFEKNKIFINDTQYFGKVPDVSWNFYIGGYQPAQKWLKDRKNRTLTGEEIKHYQKIIVILNETNNIMKEIDKIEV